MVQPDLDYYVVAVMGCVEPVLHGPFETETQQQVFYDGLMEDPGDAENTFYTMNVTKGATVIL